MQLSKDQLLQDLFSAYYDARKYKRNEASALQFEADFERHIVDLCDEIYSRKYKTGRSTCFIINKPVQREIFAATFRDRVVHHLVFNYTAPLFERLFIDDSYSCRTGRGTLYGINRVHRHLCSCTENFTKSAYVLKLDIQGYFMNINRRMLYDRVVKMMRTMADRTVYTSCIRTWAQTIDYDLLEYLLYEIIFTDPTINCTIKGSTRDWQGLPRSKSLFGTPRECGLPIGNLTSQLFSNIYLADFDNYCKRVLKLKHYGRYVDDFLVIHRDKQFLESLIPLMNDFLKGEFALQLHPRKVYLQHYSKGVTFLGVTIRGAAIYPGKRMCKSAFTVVRRANSAVCGWDEWDDDRTSEFVEIFAQRVNSYLGQMTHCQGANVRRGMVGAISPKLRQWVESHSSKHIVKCGLSGEISVLESSPRKISVNRRIRN